MAYRLPGGRSTLTPVEGCDVEVTALVVWPLYQTAVGLAAAYFGAPAAGEYAALERLYGFFCIEAQPTWAIVDHRGAIPATPAGMMRLPIPLAFEMIEQWSAAFVAAPAETAADKLLPPGPVRDRVNAQLRAVA
jgi:hypothetical protein